MTSPPSPPNRRRRRIVVTVAALLALVMGWGFWPRVDQRFVGTWGFVRGDDHEKWQFRSDGTCEYWVDIAGEPPEMHHQYRWCFDGKAIVFRRRYGDWTELIPMGILYAGSKTPIGVDKKFTVHRVSSIEPNRIRVEMFLSTFPKEGDETAVWINRIAD